MAKSANTKAKSRPARKGRPLMSRKSVAAAVVGIASVINACMSPNPFERERSADVQTPLKNAVVSVANQFADGPAGRVSAEGMQKIITAFPRANLCLKRVRENLAERRAAKRDEFGRVDISRTWRRSCSASARRTSALSPACLRSLKSCSKSSVARLKAEYYTILIMHHTGLLDITCLRLQQSLRARGSTMRPSA